MEKAPHVAKVHMILNKIWKFGDNTRKIDVYEMDSVTMRIRITSEGIRERIIKRGMWYIAGIPMVVSKWSPVEDEAGKLTPLWMHLEKVPMCMYSWEGLSFISSAACIPDKLHPETIACPNFEVAKVYVKAGLLKQLPTKMNFTTWGKDILVEFTYPWLPTKCSKCGKWGHSEIICFNDKKEEDKQQEVEKSLELKVQEGIQKKVESSLGNDDEIEG